MAKASKKSRKVRTIKRRTSAIKSKGQIYIKSIAQEIQRLENAHTIQPTTKICLLLAGEGKATTLGKSMHNAAYSEMDADLYYISTETKNLGERMDELRDLGDRFRGAAVTIPFKQEIMKHLDVVDREAEQIGAVNTVVNVNGKFYGYNTDWIGAQNAIKERAELKYGAKAIVVGAGGAGMGIAYMLMKNRMNVTIYNRDPYKAEELADRLGLTYGGGMANIVDTEPYYLIVNATSVGAKFGERPNESAIPKEVLSKGKVAFDVVYVPHETLFLRQAEAAGLRPIYGDRMLLYQAVKQVELFTKNRKVPIEVMEKALNRNI